jgi:hypothetical protein
MGSGIRQQALIPYRVEEDAGVFHRDLPDAVPAHGMSAQTTCRRHREGAVVAVDIGDQILGDEPLTVAHCHRI